MSARDSSDPAGPGNRGAGGLGNGGVGGGFGGGAAGGSGGYGAGGGFNGGYGSRTGLSTGSTMYGNTAFGRPGQMAVGYAMRDPASLAAAGMGPMAGSFGQFRTLQGNPMFAGSPVQGQSFTGMTAGQAFSQAQRQQAALRAAQAARKQVGGLLDGEDVTVAPVADPVPPAIPRTYVPSKIHQIFDPTPWVSQPAAPAVYGSYWSRNPTSYPQYARDWEKGQWAENSTYGGMAQPNAPHWGRTEEAPGNGGY